LPSRETAHNCRILDPLPKGRPSGKDLRRSLVEIERGSLKIWEKPKRCKPSAIPAKKRGGQGGGEVS